MIKYRGVDYAVDYDGEGKSRMGRFKVEAGTYSSSVKERQKHAK